MTPAAAVAAPAALLDVPAVARVLGVSQWVVRNYIASGVLPCVKLPSVKRPGEVSRRVLVAPADLDAFISRHREVLR